MWFDPEFSNDSDMNLRRNPSAVVGPGRGEYLKEGRYSPIRIERPNLNRILLRKGNWNLRRIRNLATQGSIKGRALRRYEVCNLIQNFSLLSCSKEGYWYERRSLFGRYHTGAQILLIFLFFPRNMVIQSQTEFGINMNNNQCRKKLKPHIHVTSNSEWTNGFLIGFAIRIILISIIAFSLHK